MCRHGLGASKRQVPIYQPSVRVLVWVCSRAGLRSGVRAHTVCSEVTPGRARERGEVTVERVVEQGTSGVGGDRSLTPGRAVAHTRRPRGSWQRGQGPGTGTLTAFAVGEGLLQVRRPLCGASACARLCGHGRWRSATGDQDSES